MTVDQLNKYYEYLYNDTFLQDVCTEYDTQKDRYNVARGLYLGCRNPFKVHPSHYIEVVYHEYI